ncbi:hypothetical protein EJB05_56800, partial [Eragrostis curvula]
MEDLSLESFELHSEIESWNSAQRRRTGNYCQSVLLFPAAELSAFEHFVNLMVDASEVIKHSTFLVSTAFQGQCQVFLY